MKNPALIVLALALALVLTACAPGGGESSAPDGGAASAAASSSAPAQDGEGSDSSSPPEDAENAEPAPVYAKLAYDEEVPALRELFADSFLVGAAINTPMFQEGSQSCKTILRHYNLLTCENEMKPENMNPAEGDFQFSNADKFIEFCQANDIAAHGHCLVWHSQVPDWWFQGAEGGDATSEELLERIHNYISAVAGRYAGDIAVWDVVNEAMNDDGTLRGEADGSKYTSIIGDLNGDGHYYDYVEQAFIWAREADPDAMLIYNDYSLESSTAKAQAVYDMLRDMMERGVPVDGVGLQMHIQYGWPDINTIRKNIKLLSRLKEINPDFTVQITELDMSIFDASDTSTEKEPDRISTLITALRWAELFDLFREEGVYAVTTWGVSDAATWLDVYPVPGRTDAPLLFDRQYITKPQYWALIDPTKVGDAIDELMGR